MIIDVPQTTRALWPLAIVEELLTSRDGRIRAAKVRYNSTDGKLRSVNRPINKLILLEEVDHNNKLPVQFVDERDVLTVVDSGGGVL